MLALVNFVKDPELILTSENLPRAALKLCVVNYLGKAGIWLAVFIILPKIERAFE